MLVTAYLPRYLTGWAAGSEITAHALLKPLVAAGHEVHAVLGDQAGEEYVLDGVQVHPTVDKRRDILARVPVSDLIIVQQETYRRGHLLAHKYRRASASFVHSRLTSRQYGDLTVYNTQVLADEFAGARDYVVVHPAVDPDDYHVEETGDAITLVNLNADKGAEVFYALAKRFPQQRFLGVRGAYGKQLECELPNVEIMGPTADMREVYAQTRVLLMPSKHESYGRVAVEAAASGIPSIVSDLPGLREAMGDGATYVSSLDVEDWATALKRVKHPRWHPPASGRAMRRSAEIEEDRKAELDAWVLAAEEVARRWKGIRR
jgi:glycosyltransferase involved in cell wall biosynthesis